MLTIRVSLSPFGNNCFERTIGHLVIANISQFNDKKASYSYRFDMDRLPQVPHISGTIEGHKKSEGFEILVSRVLRDIWKTKKRLEKQKKQSKK